MLVENIRVQGNLHTSEEVEGKKWLPRKSKDSKTLLNLELQESSRMQSLQSPGKKSIRPENLSIRPTYIFLKIQEYTKNIFSNLSYT